MEGSAITYCPDRSVIRCHNRWYNVLGLAHRPGVPSGRRLNVQSKSVEKDAIQTPVVRISAIVLKRRFRRNERESSVATDGKRS
jgi:hypothetical protein